MDTHLYTYEGPVKSFDDIRATKWRGETYAVSEARARVNLQYQYKREQGLHISTHIVLPGKIKLVK